MEYTRLGRTDLEVAKIGFGTLGIGGNWGSVRDEESITTIRGALDMGINLFDTGDIYGRGRAEEILGKTLAGRREKVIIATKGGLDWEQFGNQFPGSDEQHYGVTGKKASGVTRNCHSEYIQSAINASLRRLNTDYIDLYQIHYPNVTVPWEETIEVLLESQAKGKIRYIGVSNFSTQQIREWLRLGPVDAVQPPYHLLDRQIEEELLPFCRQNNIGVLTYGTLAYGLLTGKFSEDTEFQPNDARAAHPLFGGENYKRNLAIVKKLKKIAATKGITSGQLAIAWILSQPGVTSALVGAKHPSQVEENAAAIKFRLDEDELEEIEEILVNRN